VSTETPRNDAWSDDTVIRPPRQAPIAQPPQRDVGRRKKPVVLAVLGAVLALVLALYIAGFVLAGDRLPKDAQVSGVAVGGLDRAQAIEKLTAELGARAAQPIEVTAGGKPGQLKPADAGLTIDYAQSVDVAGGSRTFDPRKIVTVLVGGRPTDAVVVVDENKLTGAVQSLAATIDQAPVDATLAYKGTAVKRVRAEPGLAVDTAAAATAISQGFLTARAPVELPTAVTEPTISDDEAARVAQSFARPAVSDPIKVTAGSEGSFTISPEMIARAITFAAQDGTLVPDLDGKKLLSNAAPAVKEVELTEPRDATVRLVNGKPKVIPAVNGTEVAAADLKNAVEPALTKSGRGRTVAVELSGAKAEFSTAEAEKLGIKRVTGEFTTRFPYLEYRNINIGRAAELIDGTVLKPGETFSLNGIVGERTRANGFTEGYIIQGGKFKKELGGGVSQSATTTFNAMFFAGLKDIQHQPHSLYVDRYPPGREATVAWPSVDLKFQNDTKYGVLVQAFVVKAAPGKQGSITVRMWSTKTYDKVTSTTPVKSNFTTGQDLKDKSADCEPQEPVPGFDADYSRLFYNDGKVVKRENFHWRYAPTNKVTCI
jgi:vancomycin resistance protein YoaR